MTDDRWEVRTVVDDEHHVRAEVDGESVDVWCDDLVLRPTAEAWATAFALPASRAGATLVLDGPVDRRWARGAARNVADAASWWGGSPLQLEARGGRRRRWRWDQRHGEPPAGRALCFTGGVDSFHALLTAAQAPTHLAYVAGFDVDLDDQDRVAAVERTVRTVADHRGLRAAIVRTDLRAHPRFASSSWEHTHGAALAAVGLLLSQEVGTLVIPPSYAAHRLVPWGSRPDLDPRWGIPGRLRIEHGDAAGTRSDRVRAIAHDPLVHEHLRVCWQNVPGTVNCGRCEKCVRTATMLAAAGALDRCRTLPGRADLPAAIDALAPLPAGTAVMWEDLLPATAPHGGPDDAERAAIDRLLARSQAGAT